MVRVPPSISESLLQESPTVPRSCNPRRPFWTTDNCQAPTVYGTGEPRENSLPFAVTLLPGPNPQYGVVPAGLAITEDIPDL